MASVASSPSPRCAAVGSDRLLVGRARSKLAESARPSGVTMKALHGRAPFEDLHARRGPGPAADVLICGNPGPMPYLVTAPHREVRVASESVSELQQLRTLLERHAPSVVVFTRASLDRLVGSADDSHRAPAIATHSRLSTVLSPANAELVRLVAKGMHNADIGRATGMKRRTVRAHLSDLFREFGVTNRTQLIGALLRPDPPAGPATSSH